MTMHTSLTTLTDPARPRRRRLPALPPIGLALIAQVVAAGLALPLLWTLPVPDAWGGLTATAVHGVIAAMVGRALGLAAWWMPINLLFVPAALVSIGSDVHPGWFLAGFILLALVYWSSYRTQVPLYLTSGSGCKVVAEILGRENGARFVDLGSGSGSVLAHVARRFPSLNCEGVELAPIPYWISRARLAFFGNCRVQWKDFWSLDLSRYDVVYAFLSPVPMSQLWEKVRNEMRPGTLFISNSFPVMGVAPEEIITVPGPIKRKLYLWRL